MELTEFIITIMAAVSVIAVVCFFAYLIVMKILIKYMDLPKYELE